LQHQKQINIKIISRTIALDEQFALFASYMNLSLTLVSIAWIMMVGRNASRKGQLWIFPLSGQKDFFRVSGEISFH